MIYLRPLPDEIHTRKNTLIVTQTVDYSIVDNQTGKSIIIPIKVANMNTGLDKDGNMFGNSIGEIPMDIIGCIYSYMDLKMKCALYGETINQKLLNF